MSIFYCFDCNKKIIGNIFKGYDKSFCSKICRYNLIKKYNFNYRCELELKTEKTENIIKKPSLRRIKSVIEPIVEPVVEQVIKSEVYPVIELDIKPCVKPDIEVDSKPTIEKKAILLNSMSDLSLINLYEHLDGYRNICIDIERIDIPLKNIFISFYENTLGNLF
jgi:hypothetical protein